MPAQKTRVQFQGIFRYHERRGKNDGVRITESV